MGPTALVLSPTRELATQIQDEAVKFGKSSRISCAVSIYSHFYHIIFLLLASISMKNHLKLLFHSNLRM